MQITIAAGGTGGHVYPALAVAEALARHNPNIELFFVGIKGGFERPLVERAGIHFGAYDEILSGPLHGVNPFRALVSIIQLGVGLIQSFGVLLRRKPDAILLTGGWAGVPLAVAAWVLRVPSVLYLPDIEPGLTIRVFKGMAHKVTVTVQESTRYFPDKKTIVTGYPLRMNRLAATREDAIAHFDLDPERKTLFVTGGSRGARSINRAVIDILPQLLEMGLQIIHVTGTLDWERAREQAGELVEHERYSLFPYLHDEMGPAFAAADLVLSRAGASILGELPYFAVPAILVPYPHAWRYQRVNADYLVKRGAALRLDDDRLDSDLFPTIQGLFNSPAQLAEMGANAKNLAEPDAAAKVGQVLTDVARR